MMALFALCLVLWTLEWLLPGFAAPLVNLPVLLGVVGLLFVFSLHSTHSVSLFTRRLVLLLALIPLVFWTFLVFGLDSRFGAVATLLLSISLLLFAYFVPEKVS